MPNHARAFDLPGWPCPPRVRDIANHENSWGWGHVSRSLALSALAVDELGYLWADGDTAPRFCLPDETDGNPGVLLCWTPDGLGAWVHPKSMSSLPQISRLDMKPDQWIPIAVALAEIPPHVKENSDA